MVSIAAAAGVGALVGALGLGVATLATGAGDITGLGVAPSHIPPMPSRAAWRVAASVPSSGPRRRAPRRPPGSPVRSGLPLLSHILAAAMRAMHRVLAPHTSHR